MTMKIRFYTLFLLLFAVVATATDTSCNVYFNLSDFSLRPTAVNNVTLTPLTVPGSYNGKVLDAQAITKTTDVNGSVTFSNVVAGYPYQVVLSRVGTTFQIVLPVALTGTVNGHDYIGNFAGQFFQYYYTSNLLAASFDPLGAAQQATNTIAAPAIVGLVTSNQIATINPSQIYPAVSVSGGQTNWDVSAITNAGNLAYSNQISFATWATNGLATTNYVNTLGTTVSNGVYGQIPTSIITNNYAGDLTIASANVYFSNTNGNIYVTNHIYDASTSQLDPQANEYVTATFVRSVLNNGQILYGTPNVTSVGFTNYDGSTNTVALQFGLTSPTNYIKQFSNFVAGTYWASVISTNTFQSVSGPYVNDLYVNLDSASSNPNPPPSFTMMPDIYATYDKTNLIFLSGGAPQSIVYHTTNLYTWIQSSAQYTSTNAAGFYIVRRVKCNSFANGGGAAKPVINVFGGSNYITSFAFNTPVTVNANYSGTFTGNGAGLTNLSLPYTSITNSPWITTNSFTSLISSSNFVKATVTNGLTGNSNNFYGIFSSTAVVNKITTNSIITTNIIINSVVVSGITNVPASPYDITESHYNGTYSWDAAVGSQGAWGKGGTNAFGYTSTSQGGTYFGITFSTNYSIFDDSTYVQLQDASAQWGVQSGTTLSGRYFTGLVSPVVFLFQDNATFQSVTFTLSTTYSYTTNFTYITNYFNNVLNGAGIALAAASGNTNLLISNNDPWFTADKNPTLDVSGSVDQALVVKGSVYTTGSITATNAGNSLIGGTFTGTHTGNGSSLTNLVFPAVTFASIVGNVTGNGGMLWNSNKVLYWVTTTKTNLVSDGR